MATDRDVDLNIQPIRTRGERKRSAASSPPSAHGTGDVELPAERADVAPSPAEASFAPTFQGQAIPSPAAQAQAQRMEAMQVSLDAVLLRMDAQQQAIAGLTQAINLMASTLHETDMRSRRAIEVADAIEKDDPPPGVLRSGSHPPEGLLTSKIRRVSEICIKEALSREDLLTSVADRVVSRSALVAAVRSMDERVGWLEQQGPAMVAEHPDHEERLRALEEGMDGAHHRIAFHTERIAAVADEVKAATGAALAAAGDRIQTELDAMGERMEAAEKTASSLRDQQSDLAAQAVDDHQELLRIQGWIDRRAQEPDPYVKAVETTMMVGFEAVQKQHRKLRKQVRRLGTVADEQASHFLEIDGRLDEQRDAMASLPGPDEIDALKARVEQAHEEVASIDRAAREAVALAKGAGGSLLARLVELEGVVGEATTEGTHEIEWLKGRVSAMAEIVDGAVGENQRLQTILNRVKQEQGAGIRDLGAIVEAQNDKIEHYRHVIYEGANAQAIKVGDLRDRVDAHERVLARIESGPVATEPVYETRDGTKHIRAWNRAMKPVPDERGFVQRYEAGDISPAKQEWNNAHRHSPGADRTKDFAGAYEAYAAEARALTASDILEKQAEATRSWGNGPVAEPMHDPGDCGCDECRPATTEEVEAMLDEPMHPSQWDEETRARLKEQAIAFAKEQAIAFAKGISNAG